MLRLLVGLLLIAFAAAPAAAQPWSGILAPSRAMDWRDAGVVGGIPSAAWPRCTTAACNTLCGSFSGGVCTGGSVTATTIQNALASAPANSYVLMPSGSFSLSAFNHTRSDVALRGAGASLTKLTPTSGQSGGGLGAPATVQLMNTATETAVFSPFATTASWTATNYNQGQTTITLSSTSGITAGPVGTGTLIFLDQLNDASDGYPTTGDLYICETSAGLCSNQGDANHFGRPGRGMIQAVTVTALAGSVATISPGLRMPNWRASQSPGAWWVPTTAPIHNAGLEDFSIDFTALGGGVGVRISNAVNCWVQGLRILTTQANSNSETYHLFVFQSAHLTMRSNYLWGKQSDAGSPLANYTYSDQITSDLLFENNILHHNITPIVPNDPATGNVYAYNYVDDAYTFGSTLQFHHGEVMALVEGNNMKNVLGDIIHGPHYMNTLFRNHFDRLAHNQSGPVNQPVNLNSNNRFYNLIGNVAGNASYTRYEQVCPGQSGCAVWPYDGDQTAVFVLGDPGSGSQPSGTPPPPDSNVARTTMRWGNWDSFTSTNDTGSNDSTGTRFVAGEVPSGITNFPNAVPGSQALPPSLYLAGKPSWWAPNPAWGIAEPGYPAVGPDVVASGSAAAPNTASVPTGGHAYKIPARNCFENSALDPAYPSSSPRIKLFDRAGCYFASVAGPPATPTGITVTGINGTGLTAILSGSQVSVSYTEPTTFAGGGALTDLQKTTISYQLGSDPPVMVMDVTASAPGGGGPVNQTFSVPLPLGFSRSLTVSATATNASGASAAAQSVKTLDRSAEASAGTRR